jgi:hypothetical protein
MESTLGGNEMMCSNPELGEQRRHRGWVTPFSLVVVGLLVMAVGALIALHYRSHLFWRYTASRFGLNDIRAIPDRPMPESPTPDGWLRCHVGCVEFSLPPELVRNRVAQQNGASTVMFQHGSRAVVVAVPTDASDVSGLLTTASELCPQSQRFTVPKLRRACYRASSADFRWSMTPSEVRWHAFCITTGKLIRSLSDGHTESFFREDLHGIVHFGDERTVLDWQSNDLPLGGYMHFIDRQDQADKSWIREVCQSLKVSNEAECHNSADSSRQP